MATVKIKTAAALSEVKSLWKKMVGNLHPEADTFNEIFIRYKTFVKQNKMLFPSEKFTSLEKELNKTEKMVRQYQEMTSLKDKRFLLSDASIGLMFTISESIEVLKSQLERNAFATSES